MTGHPWIRRIKVGDVLRSPKGALRVVRAVQHSNIPFYGIRTSVTFTIMRCSWTTRCYTIYTGNDLVQMGYSPTRGKVPLRKRIDKAIAEEFQRPGGIAAVKLHCCDVLGVL